MCKKVYTRKHTKQRQNTAELRPSYQSHHTQDKHYLHKDNSHSNHRVGFQRHFEHHDGAVRVGGAEEGSRVGLGGVSAVTSDVLADLKVIHGNIFSRKK